MSAVCACAFAGCSEGVAEVTYSLSEDGSYYIVSGVSGSKSALGSYEIPATYTATNEDGSTVTLPVKEIGSQAFMQCRNLSSVTIPEGIEKIGSQAFVYCSFMEITIPNTVTEIGERAFGGCSLLKEITIPESVTEIGNGAFRYCSGLEKATVKANISDLGANVFANTAATSGGYVYTDTKLTEVYLPATLKKIDSTALENNFIEAIYFAGTVDEWNALYFYETNDDGTETKVDKSEIMTSYIVDVDTAVDGAVKIYCNADFYHTV